jgi:hypothetical protein
MSDTSIRRCAWIAAALVTLAAGVAADAAEWGSIKGKFMFKGEVTNEPLVITKDEAYCGPKMPKDETVMVGEGGALQNVFVYLYVPRTKKIAVHPDYKPGDPQVLKNEGCRFEPHAMTLWNVNELHVTNEDPGVGHNTNFTLAGRNIFNTIVPNDAPLKRKFTQTGPSPAVVACNVHPWMRAYVLVRDNPYMAATGEDGTFEIKNVSAGAQEFVVWHESVGYLKNLMIGAEKLDRKGQFKAKIPAGEALDLGVIEVAPALLGK